MMESVLVERAFTSFTNKKGEEITILKNPTPRDIARLNAKTGWLRGFLAPDGSIYVFDAYYSTHWEVGLATGLSGRRFEVRSAGIYVPHSETERMAEWKVEPALQRMYGGEVPYVGLLRS